MADKVPLVEDVYTKFGDEIKTQSGEPFLDKPPYDDGSDRFEKLKRGLNAREKPPHKYQIAADPVTGRGDARGPGYDERHWPHVGGYDYGREDLGQEPTKDEKEAKDQMKGTNPKDAIGIKKPGISSMPTGATALGGLAMMEGARKYGRHNYREAGVRVSVYYDALWRHMMAYYDYSQDTDPGSGLPHLAKAIACLTVLLDAHMSGKINDDRPPPLPLEWLDKMQSMTDELFERYPTCVPAVTRESQG